MPLTRIERQPEKNVAIIGGGPAGLVACRYLAAHGFEPVIFEQSDSVGGQWNGGAAHSGVWPVMRTNTSRVMTCFSDLPHEPGTAVYPKNQGMLAYLKRYAGHFELAPRIRLRTRVELVERASPRAGWQVHSVSADGVRRTELFPRLVVAPGRYHQPRIPSLSGLDSFSGPGGAIHAFHYKEPERYRGLRVLVAGCSISALEIAADLAMLGAARVISTFRRQRYIFHKLLAGVPTDHVAFTRFAALAEESLPPDVVAAGLKELVLRTSGSPEQFGAHRPVENIFEAGVTQCQNFLPLVAEGRIVTRPWIEQIRGQTVRFVDGTEEEVDAILFGTGYDLHLPFLSPDIRRVLNVDADHIDLYKHTFHPDLPGLAFLGQFALIGPYFPVVESQARWVVYTWAGLRPAPSREALEAGLAAARAQRGGPLEVPMHRNALLFAREAGVEPDLGKWPDLARALLFGPLSAVSFRLDGPDHLPDAAARFAEDAAAFGAIRSPELTADQCEQLKALAAARHDDTLGALARPRTAVAPQ